MSYEGNDQMARLPAITPVGFDHAARIRGVAASQRSCPSGPVRPSWSWVIRHALCRYVSLDPDQWFPASADAESARREAAAAIAICHGCPARAQCLAISLQYGDIGQHGVWGGLVPAERATLRSQRRTAQLLPRGHA
jgi:WhiB family redox-sensing transcriptional regulator